MEKNVQMIEVCSGLEIESVCALSYFLLIPLICPALMQTASVRGNWNVLVESQFLYLCLSRLVLLFILIPEM